MYIIWKDIDSRAIDGLIIQSIPPITKPKMKVAVINIDGRDGDIIEDLGYEAYDKEVKIGLKSSINIDDVCNFFTGEGELITSEEPNKIYKAKIINQLDYERILKFRESKIIFHTQPYKYLKNEKKVINTYTSNSKKELKVTNLGDINSKPLIHLKGDGLIEFSINGYISFSYNFDDDKEVYIDSEEIEAYLGENLKNHNMNGDFPLLKSGENTITWNGNITYIEISPKSRWL